MYNPDFHIFSTFSDPVQTVKSLQVNLNDINGIEHIADVPVQDGLVVVTETSYVFDNGPAAVTYTLMVEQEQPWYSKLANMMASGTPFYKCEQSEDVIGYELLKVYSSAQKQQDSTEFYIGAPIKDTRYSAHPII